MNTRKDVLGVVAYAHKHDYEPHECMNLLRSKNLHEKMTERKVQNLYNKFEREGYPE